MHWARKRLHQVSPSIGVAFVMIVYFTFLLQFFMGFQMEIIHRLEPKPNALVFLWIDQVRSNQCCRTRYTFSFHSPNVIFLKQGTIDGDQN